MNVFLIGPRGCGKTTVGTLLGSLRHQPFVDLDDVARASFHERNIVEVWKTHGETAWRRAEVAALVQVRQTDGRIIALGGGAPMIEEAKSMIDEDRRAHCVVVVYIKTSLNDLVSRLRAMPGDRPSLTGGDVAAEVLEVLARREPTYLDLADIVYDAADQSPDEVAEGIAACLPKLT